MSTDTPIRRKFIADRKGVTHRFKIGEEKGYVTVNLFPDGQPGEIFIKMAKTGTAISGLLDALSISVSLGLQHGVPLAIYCQKFSHTQFEPDGFTGPEFHFASSVIDYIFRWMESRYVKKTEPPIANPNKSLQERS